eukprot:scaffold58497_cov45-Attheya_sp.AAC.4
MAFRANRRMRKNRADVTTTERRPLMGQHSNDTTLSYYSTKKDYSTKNNSDTLATKEMDNWIQRLRETTTCRLCDADKSLQWENIQQSKQKGVPQEQEKMLHASNYEGIHIMDDSIRMQARPSNMNGKPPTVMVGVAHTVQCTHANDALAILRGLEEAKTGDVLVVNTMGSSLAMLSKLLLAEAERKKLAGVIIDGPARVPSNTFCDTWCFSTKNSPYLATMQSIGETQVHVECGGIRVLPGDMIMADSLGILVGSKATFQKALEETENIRLAEKELLKGLRENIPLHSMTNLKEHLELRRMGKESALELHKTRLAQFHSVTPIHMK